MPKYLKNDKWQSLKIFLVNYIMIRKGFNDVPLAYVIHKEPRVPSLTTTRETEILYGAPLVVATFSQSSTEVFDIVNQLTFDQNSINWIERRTRV